MERGIRKAAFIVLHTVYISMWKYCFLYFAVLWHRNEKQQPVVVVLAKRLRENLLSLKTFAMMMTDEILCANGRNIITNSRPKWKHCNTTYWIKYSWEGAFFFLWETANFQILKQCIREKYYN